MAYRVLFVSHTAELNGAERMLLLTLKRLDRKKIAPSLAVPREGLLAAEIRGLGLPVHIVPTKWWLTPPGAVWKQPLAWLWNRAAVHRLTRLIKAEGFDLVFTNSSAVSSGALAARRASVPHIWSIHEILSGPQALLSYIFGQRRLSRRIHGLSARVIVNSSATEAAFKGLEGVRLVYNGVEPDKQAERRNMPLRKSLGLQRAKHVLGVVGKIMPAKGQKEIILALAKVAGSRPGIHLLVIGEARDRKYLRELKNLVLAHGLDDKVHFTGFVPDVAPYVRAMDLLVIASQNESFGRVAVEAMAAGTAVLAVAVGGLREVIEPDRTGFLVESSEPEVLAGAIDRILENPGLAQQVVRESRRAIARKFDLGTQVKAVERILVECASRRTGHD